MMNCIDCNKILTNHHKHTKRCKSCSHKNHSIIMKGRYKGKENPFYGKHHTKEVCKKISDIKKELYKTRRSENYKGGRLKNKDGYILIWSPDNNKVKNYEYEHRFGWKSI